MRSISVRFIAVFIVLVMVNAVIFGVLFVRFLNESDLEVVETRVNSLAAVILPKLETYGDLSAAKKEIQSYLELQQSVGFGEQVFVISKNEIIASLTAIGSKLAEDQTDMDLLIAGESGKTAAKNVSYTYDNNNYRSYDKVFPIFKNALRLGTLYIKHDLKELDMNAANSVSLMLTSLIISLSVSLIMATLIARSITGPINEVTRTASKIANGNFRERLVILSDDEIGKLAGTFNYMAGKLSLTLDEIFTEKKKLEAIVNNIKDALIAAGINGDILHLNPSARLMLEYLGVEDFYSYMEISRNFPPELQFENLINGNYKEFSYNYHLGNYIYFVSCEHFFDELGNLQGYILLFQDMTKERELDNMRKDFIANVSHELKTPITVIRSYAETLIETDDLSREMRISFIGTMEREAARMGRIVNDLLQLSSLDSGKIVINKEVYELNSFLEKIISKHRVGNPDIVINLKKEKEKIFLKFDYDRIEQVMTNLITNSIKYSKRKPEITISTGEEGDYVFIRLEDNGVGIAQEDIPEIFKRFYRVEKSRTREQGGSGLGLAIVKHLLELHRGEIRVKSVLGEGSTFEIRLPK